MSQRVLTMIPPGAKEAAMETTEEVKKAAKEAAFAAKESFHSFYSQVSCTDLSAIQGVDCNPIKNRRGGDMEGAVTLDWRADPFVSMSDLTLVVYDGSAGIPYHVHTLLLAYGGRKSGFVGEQIKSQKNRVRSSSKSSKRSNSSRSSSRSIQRQNSEESDRSNVEYKVDIYVPALAARHVPLFLDYIYGSSLKITTATAPSLRYLSNRFDCRDLHKEVTSRFIPQDLELNTAPQYCTMADELKDFELRDKSIRIMAERFEKINVNFLKWMTPRMMRNLVQSERLECGSESLSIKVAQYLRLHDDMSNEREDNFHSTSAQAKEKKKQMTPLADEDFYWLTHCQHMPKISPNEALFYFSYGNRYPQVMNEIGSGSLKSRCLAACCESSAMDKLTSHLENTDNVPLELYENLEMKMKVQLLESSLVGVKKLMMEKEKQSSQRYESDRDMRMSDEIMYSNNEDRSVASKSSIAKVVVLGCGVAPANGVYLYHDKRSTAADSAAGHHSHEKALVYEKEAVWKQQRVTFELYPTASGQYYTQYKLAVRQKKNGERIKVLYNSPTVMGGVANNSNGGGILPEQAWEVEEDDDMEGLHPPPQFVGRMGQ